MVRFTLIGVEEYGQARSQARAFENARYGEFRIVPTGGMILTLRDSYPERRKGAAK